VGEKAPRRQVNNLGQELEKIMTARQTSTLLVSSIATLTLLLASAACPAAPRQAAPTFMAGPGAASPQQAEMLTARLNGARSKYGLDQDHGYRLTAQHPGEAGTRISRFAHTYKGVRVFQSESVVVTDNAGNIISESMSDRRKGLGRGRAPSGLSWRFADFDVNPALSAQAAIDTVVHGMAPGASHAASPSAELVIYPIVKRVRVQSAIQKREWQLNAKDLVGQVTGYELAYLVQARMTSGERPYHVDAIVSASDGRVIAQWNALQTVEGVGHSQYNGQVPISTTQSDGTTFSMNDPRRGVGGRFGGNAITNAAHGSTAGFVYDNSSNHWGDGQDYIAGGSTTNANGQTAAVNAMWGLANTYDMLKNVLGWYSLDGENTATYIAVHVYSQYENAYYSSGCRCMFVGDGANNFYNLSSVDVIAHEMGHGVTNSTSGLMYFGESGGLNESASDINGEMTEAYARAGGTGNAIPATGNDWKIAQEISRTGNPLRWMYKPSKDGSSADAWSSSLSYLDVHYSSGPNNRMFYFLSQGSSASSASDYYSPYLTRSPRAMSGIGNDKAYRIWFRALTTKFTSSTDYAEARDKVLEAAQELYGVNSREAIAVQRAYAAINVGSDVDETGSGPAPLAITSQPQDVIAAVGATATFFVGLQGGTPPYKYQWRRNGMDIAGATSASYSMVVNSDDDGVGFSARVLDSALAPYGITSSTAILSLPATGPSERVLNGSFEYGSAVWYASRGVIGTWPGSTQRPYDGDYFAYLGGTGRTTTETLSQTVQIPINATSAVLSFALHIDTGEYSMMVPYDTLTVALRNPAGYVLATLGRYSNLDAATGYQLRSFDLSAYRGQTLTLAFAMSEDFSLQTSFTVDKVSLIAQ
jgi:Zn-dependent metalloprotease